MYGGCAFLSIVCVYAACIPVEQSALMHYHCVGHGARWLGSNQLKGSYSWVYCTDDHLQSPGPYIVCFVDLMCEHGVLYDRQNKMALTKTPVIFNSAHFQREKNKKSTTYIGIAYDKCLQNAYLNQTDSMNIYSPDLIVIYLSLSLLVK